MRSPLLSRPVSKLLPRQHRLTGRGAFAYHGLRSRRGSGRIRDDFRFPTELARRLIGAARMVAPQTAVRGAVLAAVWQVANAAGWAEAAVESRGQELATRLSAHRSGS